MPLFYCVLQHPSNSLGWSSICKLGKFSVPMIKSVSPVLHSVNQLPASSTVRLKARKREVPTPECQELGPSRSRLIQRGELFVSAAWAGRFISSPFAGCCQPAVAESDVCSCPSVAGHQQLRFLSATGSLVPHSNCLKHRIQQSKQRPPNHRQLLLLLHHHHHNHPRYPPCFLSFFLLCDSSVYSKCRRTWAPLPSFLMPLSIPPTTRKVIYPANRLSLPP